MAFLACDGPDRLRHPRHVVSLAAGPRRRDRDPALPPLRDRPADRAHGSWAVVTGLLVGGFAVAVVALQAVLADFIQGQTIAVAASTLVAFALFQPLRRRVQSAVDRRFDRARYDAQRTVAEFSDRLRDEVDLAALSGDLDTTIRDAISPRSLGIWLRESRR